MKTLTIILPKKREDQNKNTLHVTKQKFILFLHCLKQLFEDEEEISAAHF